MSTTDYHYWPFTVVPAMDRSPQEQAQIEFLETAYRRGYESFRFGTNDYGARSENREGCILERGRIRWEIRLAEGRRRALIAFLQDFGVAAKAVEDWLDGLCAKELLDRLQSHLITPPGAKASYVLTDESCPD